MSPAEARREACRILRDSQRSMCRSLAEAERLLHIADASDAEDDFEVESRRSELYERAINPEFFTDGARP